MGGRPLWRDQQVAVDARIALNLHGRRKDRSLDPRAFGNLDPAHRDNFTDQRSHHDDFSRAHPSPDAGASLNRQRAFAGHIAQHFSAKAEGTGNRQVPHYPATGGNHIPRPVLGRRL